MEVEFVARNSLFLRKHYDVPHVRFRPEGHRNTCKTRYFPLCLEGNTVKNV